MSNKKIVVSLFLMFVIVIDLTAFLYFKYWQEPAAKYLETDNPELVKIREDLNQLKSDLKVQGEYNCCIRNDCSWCALYMGHCPCADMVVEKENEKSCPECAAAWNRKQGKIPGVDKEAVKVTTFGVYGFEKGHHHPDVSGENDHHLSGHEPGGVAENPQEEQLSGEVSNGVREIKLEAFKFGFDPATIVVIKSDKVKMTAGSKDVMHGIAIEELGIKREIAPGQETIIEFTAKEAGRFNFRCSVFCGAGHGGMSGTLIVKEDGFGHVEAEDEHSHNEKGILSRLRRLELHPMAVHFPIALFIGALGLEVLSRIFKKESLHYGAWYNYLLATVFSVGAVITGLLSAGSSYNQVMYTHRLLAFLTLSIAVGSLVVLSLIKKRFSKTFRVLFLIFLILTAGLVSVCGYYGGEMVYGDSAGAEPDQ